MPSMNQNICVVILSKQMKPSKGKASEEAAQLKALVALPGDLHSILSTLMTAHNRL